MMYTATGILKRSFNTFIGGGDDEIVNPFSIAIGMKSWSIPTGEILAKLFIS